MLPNRRFPPECSPGAGFMLPVGILVTGKESEGI